MSSPTEARVVDLAAVRRGRPTTIPGSNQPVAIERLHLDRDTLATVSVVDFPAGWSRRDLGTYSVVEEFVLLTGSLTVSDLTFRPGEWVHLPAHWPRVRSWCGAGARALAFFAGAPLWTPGPPPAGAHPPEPVHGPALTMTESWRPDSPAMQGFVERSVPSTAPEGVVRDVLSLATSRWALIGAGVSPPAALPGPWVVRRWG